MPGIAFGGDYNPEQWPEDIWAEDIALMGEAGVSMVTVGVFSWALLEPAQGSYEFGWLDRVMDLLAAADIAVDLATATASPPPWFSHRYPESLPVTREGHRLWQGARQAYCPSSTAYRAAATALAGALAQPVRDPSGVGDVAREQRVRLPHRGMLLRRERRGISPVAAASVTATSID